MSLFTLLAGKSVWAYPQSNTKRYTHKNYNDDESRK